MISSAASFSARLTQKITRTMLVFVAFVSVSLLAVLINMLSTQISATQKKLNLQLQSEILRISSYGEFIQLQPFQTNAIKGLEPTLSTYLSIEQVNSHTRVAYAGDESAENSFFKISHRELIEVPVLGSVAVVSVIGYDKKVGLAFAVIAILSACFLGVVLFLKRQIQSTITAQSLGIDELEVVLKNLEREPAGISENDQFKKAASMIQNFAAAQAQLIAAEKINLMARQVSHDIRSPLSALSMVVSSIKGLSSEQQILIRDSSKRINDIANDLLDSSRTLTSEAKNAEPIDLSKLVDSIVREKQILNRSRSEIEILKDVRVNSEAWLDINPVELSRLISNLINNSVEAISGAGRITISIRDYPKQISLVVSDNGKGIPETLLKQLGALGVTEGKTGAESGFGLGLYHARNTVENVGGTFIIQSSVGHGTMITMTFPRATSLAL